MKFHGNWNMDFLGIPRNSKLLLPVDYLVKKFLGIPKNLRKENEYGKLISIPKNSQEFLGITRIIPGINNQDWGLGLDNIRPHLKYF